MSGTYQDAAPNSRKRCNRPLLEYSMPLTKEEWEHLLEWVEQNFSSYNKQSSKEEEHETQ